MPLLDLVRRRLVQPSLTSHAIDDDYSLSRRSSSHHHRNPAPGDGRNEIDTQDRLNEEYHLRVNSVDRINYLPQLSLVGLHEPPPQITDEDTVPSYEDSQLMYEQQQLELDRIYVNTFPNGVNLNGSRSGSVSISGSAVNVALTEQQGHSALGLVHRLHLNHLHSNESSHIGRSSSTPNMRRASETARMEYEAFNNSGRLDNHEEDEYTSGYSSSSSLIAPNARIIRRSETSSLLGFSASSNGNNDRDRTLTPTTSSSSELSLQPRSKSSAAAKSLKQIGLKFLNARQHFALAICRDICLIPSLIGLFQSWKRVFVDRYFASSLAASSVNNFTSARAAEHFLTGIWCIVAAYLSYAVLDGLMVRWIVNYLAPAAIVRMLSMSVILIAIEQYMVAAFSADGYKYGLHIWILVSCIMTGAYIVQNFVTSNLDLKGKRKQRFFDFYNIVVFAVVPVGIASFLTMIGLLRSLLILRLDLDLNQAFKQWAGSALATTIVSTTTTIISNVSVGAT